MKELIDQIDLIALPLSYHLISQSILHLVQDRTDVCVCVYYDRFRDFILFY
jgi:hypothetical protein